MTGYDGYDNFDGYDEAPVGQLRQVGAHASHDIETWLRMAIDMVQQAKSMPLSASVLVSREELLDILETAIHQMPEEIREARWALRDREELMAAEIRKAEQLMDRVRAEAARMVDKTEIVRHARVAADKIISDAEERARTLINEAEDFCDQKLGGMEIVLDRLTKTVKSGRERLRPSAAVPLAPVVDVAEVRAFEPRGTESAYEARSASVRPFEGRDAEVRAFEPRRAEARSEPRAYDERSFDARVDTRAGEPNVVSRYPESVVAPSEESFFDQDLS
jgi:cell division septum initiation protein DivIVA